MSGWSEALDCSECGGEGSLEAFGDRSSVGGNCLECGYAYKTVEEQMTLEEVNEMRKECNLEPLTQLKQKITQNVEVINDLIEAIVTEAFASDSGVAAAANEVWRCAQEDGSAWNDVPITYADIERAARRAPEFLDELNKSYSAMKGKYLELA